MDSKPVREVIEAYEEHRLEVKLQKERTKLDNRLKTLKKNSSSHIHFPKSVDKAWEMIELLRVFTTVKFEEYPTIESFFKAVFGYDIGEAKADYDYCSQFKEDHTISDIQHAEYRKAILGFNDTLYGKYQMRLLRQKWETGRYGKQKSAD